jgi:hypothetical protein
MSDEREWKWMAGILLGLGECAFQVSHGDIRRVSKLVPQQGGGIAPMKTLIGGIMKGFEQIQADGMLVFCAPVNADFAAQMDQFWGSLIMQPANGRLPKDWKAL